MNSMNIKKGDKVKVLAGKDKGKEGTILRSLPQKQRVVVEKVNIVKKALRPTQQNPQGGDPNGAQGGYTAGNANDDGTELNMAFHFEHMDLDGGESFKWNRNKIDLVELKALLTKWQKSFRNVLKNIMLH